MHHPHGRKNLVNLGLLKLCGAIAMALGQYNSVGAYILDLYKVCYNTGEQLLGPHDPQCHANTPDYGPWLCTNQVNLGWFKLCDAITMAHRFTP